MHLPIELAPDQARKVLEWLKKGRVRIWPNVDLSSAGGFYMTDDDVRPSWRASASPEAEIFSVQAFEVVTRLEIKRFRVAVRRGSQGLSFKLTDASSRRLRRELDKAGEGSDYAFDYFSQEAVITVRDKTVPLNEWALLSQKE